MNFIERVINFFREDVGEIVGVYFDGEKIFFAHLTDDIKTEKINFQIADEENFSPVEQLAEKISVTCAKNGWKTSRLGICLRNDEVISEHRYFENIPENELNDAIKSWSKAAGGGTRAVFTSVRDGEEIWLETLPEDKVEEYISACEKNSLTLCGLTAMPDFLTIPDFLAKDSGGADKAKFITEVVSEKKSPNLLAEKIGTWDWKKFSKVAAIFFFIALGIFSAKLFHDLRTATENFESAQKIFNEHGEEIILKETLEKNISAMKKINSLSETQAERNLKLDALINLGRVADGKIFLRKINTNENLMTIEGITDNPGEIKNYLGRLKSKVTPNAKLESSTTGDDGKTAFTILLTLEN